VRARALRGAVVALLLTTLLAGCSRAAAPAPVDPVRPVPAGTTVIAGAAPAAADTSCGDPRVSATPTPEPPPGAMPAGTTMANIAARGALVVGIDQSTVPLSYRDPRSGVLTGLDVRIAQEMARAVFGDPNRIRFRIESAAQRIPNLLSGQVDLVVQAMTVTCERKSRIGMSSVYYDAAQRIAVPAVSPVTGVADLGGRPVCSITGTTSIATLQAARGSNGQAPVTVGVPENSDCLVMLQQGQVDAATTDDTILAGYALEDRRIAVRGDPLATEPYGIGVAPQNTDLLRFVNSVLDRTKADGTWAAIVAATFGGTPPPPPPGQYAG
jgi:polar amino acid transport system substrate-binding protein